MYRDLHSCFSNNKKYVKYDGYCIASISTTVAPQKEFSIKIVIFEYHEFVF